VWDVTFLSLSPLVIVLINYLIFFVSREMFNKWQAQRWWAENYDKVMELYNVQRFNQQAVPLPTPPRSEDEVSIQLLCNLYLLRIAWLNLKPRNSFSLHVMLNNQS